MRLISVDLPDPGAADDRRRLARGGAERQLAQDGILGAGVAELHVPELDDAALAGIGRADGLDRVMDRRLGLEHLVDAPGGDRTARDQDEHEDRGQDGEHDLQQVLQECGERADLHRPVGDALGPEPHDRDRREVEDRRHDRDRHGEQTADLERRVEQVGAGRLEPRLLVRRPHEGADHPDAGEGLAHDLVDPVDLRLHRPEHRDGAAHHDADDERHQRQDHDEQRRQGRIRPDGHDDPADDQDRRGHDDGQAHEDDGLDLLDIIRVPGDERRRAEVVDLDLRERLDRREDRPSNVAAEAHRDPRADEHRRRRRRHRGSR